MEIIDVAPGLWIWRVEHPEWREGLGWEPPVTSTVVESGVEVAVLDGIAPPAEASELWERLDARPPTHAAAGERRRSCSRSSGRWYSRTL